MRIQTNVTAVNAHRQYGINIGNISKTTERLSSGLRVNRAADDAAGLAISEKMRTQIRGLNRASLNIQDGVSLLRVGDGALQAVHDKIQRMRELAVQAANDTNELLDRQAIQLEIGQLTSEINDTIAQARFNQKTLFDDSVGASWEWHLGLRRGAMDRSPASITAGNYFQPGIIVAGSQASTPLVGTNLNTLNGPPPRFPREGVFVIQAQIPGESMRTAVLDFGVLNTDGNFNLDDFRNFFRGADTGTVDPVTGNPVYAGGAFSDWINSGELVFNINDAGSIQMSTANSVGGNQAIIRIGPTTSALTGLPAGTRIANGPILGAPLVSASQGMINGIATGLSLANWAAASNSVWTGEAVAPITAANAATQQDINQAALDSIRAAAMNCPVFFNSLPNMTLSATLQHRTPNPDFPGIIPGTGPGTGFAAVQQPEFIWPSHALGEDTRLPLNAPENIIRVYSTNLHALRTAGATTLQEASNMLNEGRPYHYFSNATIPSPTIDVDRNGYIRVSFNPVAGPAANTGNVNAGANTANFPVPQHRVLTSVHSMTLYHNARGTSPTTPVSGWIGAVSWTSFPVTTPPPTEGTLTINIGGVPGRTIAPIVINYAVQNFETPEAMVTYINNRLNVAEHLPIPLPTFTVAGYNTQYPVARASLNAAGHLVITASERTYTVNIQEQHSNRPLFVNHRTVTNLGENNPPLMTVTVGGTQHTITMVPGNFETAHEFVIANRGAFASQGFTLSEEGGRLAIATTTVGEHLTLIEGESITTFPPALLQSLGFEGNAYVDGRAFPAETTGYLWIQSGANRGDGIAIEIPRLCARALGLSMWRPFDENDPFDGFARYSSLGAHQYTNRANVSPAVLLDPRGYSLDVTSHETATNAISVFDNAINIISEERARFGAMQNRLEFAMSNVDNSSENQQAAESRIRDADMAREMTVFTKQNILMQSSTAMLAQANALPQSVLQLLGG